MTHNEELEKDQRDHKINMFMYYLEIYVRRLAIDSYTDSPPSKMDGIEEAKQELIEFIKDEGIIK